MKNNVRFSGPTFLAFGAMSMCLAIVGGCSGSSGGQGPAGTTGERGIAGEKGETGDTGPTGNPGPDGAYRVYGDGSNGQLIVKVNADWTTRIPTSVESLQFSDFTVESGATLTIPSGLTFRVAGAATIRGTLLVEAAAIGGGSNGDTGSLDFTDQPTHPGLAASAAGSGELAPKGQAAFGGRPGRKIPGMGVGLLRPGLYGGGAGACAANSTSVGKGGGTVTIIASGGIDVTGTGSIIAVGMRASGGGGPGIDAGGGGGGGGIVSLASATSVGAAGLIDVRGGGGGDSVVFWGPGGGGGGGVVVAVAPTMNALNVNPAGGKAGTIVGMGTAASRRGGCGGGASGGDGGRGGQIDASNNFLTGQTTKPSPGDSGRIYSITADPTSLL